MYSKAYFQSYAEAQAFYDTQKGDKSIGSVKKELQAELGAWIVQYNFTKAVEQVSLEVGSNVAMVNDLPVQWFNSRFKGYPSTLTGIVLKVFKNGKVSVRVKELDNKVIHCKLTDLKLV